MELQVDLDHFKSINDPLGHSAGDLTLSDFAAQPRSVVRERDLVGRYGGEEFVVVFRATTVADAGGVLSRLRDSCLTSSLAPLTFSAGIARVEESYGEHEQAGELPVKAADDLMCEAKQPDGTG